MALSSKKRKKIENLRQQILLNPLNRTTGQKYRDREIVASWSKVSNMASSGTPVESTESEFSAAGRPKPVKNPREKLYAPLVQSSEEKYSSGQNFRILSI